MPPVTVVRYGYDRQAREWLIAQILRHIGSGLILRSFTEEVEPESGLPIKELRGWSLRVELEPVTTTTTIEQSRAAGTKKEIELEEIDGDTAISRYQSLTIISKIAQPHLVWERLNPDDVYWASNTRYEAPEDAGDSEEMASELESGRGVVAERLLAEKAVRYC